MQILNPNLPVRPFGVFRRFRAAAYVRTGASPNEGDYMDELVVITLDGQPSNPTTQQPNKRNT